MAEKLMCDFCGTIIEPEPRLQAVVKIPLWDDGGVRSFVRRPDMCVGCAEAFYAEVTKAFKTLTQKRS